MREDQIISDARSLVAESLKQLESGDKGAAFERHVLQALLHVQQEDTAEFHRLQSDLTSVGVSARDLNTALKREQARQKQEQASSSGEPLFTPDKIRELEDKGLVVEQNKGIVDIKSIRFAKYVLQKYKIVLADGDRFHFYNNGVWKQFRDKQLQRRLFDLIESIQPDVWQSGWESRYMTALSRAARHVPEFDRDKNLINLANGMFDTESMELLEHDPSFFSSIQNPIAYDRDADCPQFKRFLSKVFQEDTEIINVVQEIMGYCCTAETRAHKMFIFEGIGSNGKSVLIDVIEHLCGRQNVSHVAMNELTQPFARAELVGKLVNVSSENEFNEKGLNTQQIKSITAGDAVRVENKFEKGFSYRPVCKLLFGMNALPTTLDKSHGFFRRLVIVPFRRVFKGAEADKMLLEKLLEELPGIFNFAMEGLRRLRGQDYTFSESKAIEQAISIYKSEQNPVIPFVTDFIDKGSDKDRVGKNELFDRFQTWCRHQGETDFVSKTVHNRKLFWAAFKNALQEVGIPMPDERPSDGVRFLYGLVLLKEAKPSMADLFDDEAAVEKNTSIVTASDQEVGRHIHGAHRGLACVTVGGKFDELREDDMDDLLFEEGDDDDDDDDLKLRGTPHEDEERADLEAAFDNESIQFDLNYLPAKVFHGLGVNEWLDNKPDDFDFDYYRFERTLVGDYEDVHLA